MADELRGLIDDAIAQGWHVEPGSNGRVRWQAPDGVGLVFTPDRVRPGRDLVNIVASLRRAGLLLPERRARTRTHDKEEPMTTASKAVPSDNGKVTPQAKPAATLAEVLLDAASKVDALLRRNADLERENAELRHDLASARTRAEDVRREAMAAVERVLADRGVSWCTLSLRCSRRAGERD